MVLAGLGRDVSEQRIARLLGTKRFGTPISNITSLQRWGYKVDFQSFLPVDKLKRRIDTGHPVIVQVWPMMLPYWPFNPSGSHVVVMNGYDEQAVFVHDPAMQQPHLAISWDAFLAAWAEFDETAAVVIK